MTDINLISHDFNRMKAHINQASYAMECKEGLANDKAALTALCVDMMRSLSCIVEECTGRADMLNRSIDSIKDDLSDSFDDLIAQEAEEAEQRREEFAAQVSHRMAVNSIAFDRARA